VHHLVFGADVGGSRHHDAVVHQLLGTKQVEENIEAQFVVENGINVEFAELHLDVAELGVEPQWFVLSEFLLEELDVWGKGGGVELVALDSEELVELLFVDVQLAKVRLSPLVGDALEG
jgi:hypothetical protein